MLSRYGFRFEEKEDGNEQGGYFETIGDGEVYFLTHVYQMSHNGILRLSNSAIGQAGSHDLIRASTARAETSYSYYLTLSRGLYPSDYSARQYGLSL